MSTSPQRPDGYRTAIATVCLAGTLEEKLSAAAAAGFDGVEIFEPDLVACPLSPTQVRRQCAELGLRIDLYQPFRDLDSTDPDVLRRNLRRADLKFDVMADLGVDLILVCSSVGADAVDDDDQLAEQLHAVADRAADRGMAVAYEALAWGRYVNTWDRSWDIVRRADHPALGICLDSFHILSRGSSTAGIADLPAQKLLFLQLADAPAMEMGVLQWSRHHRLFPGQGTFDLADFVGRVLAAGYDGPLSLEVFNDVFRQSDPRRTAVDARRSLLALQEAVARQDADRIAADRRARLIQPPRAPAIAGFAFCELAVDEESGPPVAHTLSALGFARAGRHRTKPVEMWQQGGANVLLNRAPGNPPGVAEIAAFAVHTSEPGSALERAAALLAPVLPRDRADAEVDIRAVAAPDGTQVFFCPPDSTSGSWRDDFADTGDRLAADAGLTRIDHVALTQPFDAFDEAMLFYSAVLGLRAHTSLELSSPSGMLRTRAMRNPDGSVRIPLSVSLLRPSAGEGRSDPQHVAFACADIVTAAQVLRERGAPLLAIPDNYYDDLDARLGLDPGLLDRLRLHGILYDRSDNGGEFFQLYTEVLGRRVFFEVVQRVAGYQGYGAVNVPVHAAAHHRLRAGR